MSTVLTFRNVYLSSLYQLSPRYIDIETSGVQVHSTITTWMFTQIYKQLLLTLNNEKRQNQYAIFILESRP